MGILTQYGTDVGSGIDSALVARISGLTYTNVDTITIDKGMWQDKTLTLPSTTDGTYSLTVRLPNNQLPTGTIINQILIRASEFKTHTIDNPIVVFSNGTTSDTTNIMVGWDGDTFKVYGGNSAFPYSNTSVSLIIDYMGL